MSKKELKTFVVFQTFIGGQLAQTEVESDPSALYSKETRKETEGLARLAFASLSPQYLQGQPIKAVDIIQVEAEPEEPELKAADWSDVAFTCAYCGNQWNERYPAAGLVHKTLSGCRQCLVKLNGPGQLVRYTGGRDLRGQDRELSDKALSRGVVYQIAQAYKSRTSPGIRLELAGITGRFDVLLFVPAELGEH